VARRATIAELEDWERNGAVWRPVTVSPERAVIDLFSCSGELMERVESNDPELVEFVRVRPAEGAAD
jgi:hypothetical protein